MTAHSAILQQYRISEQSRPVGGLQNPTRILPRGSGSDKADEDYGGAVLAEEATEAQRRALLQQLMMHGEVCRKPRTDNA